ncbi:hypothetical protein D1007_17835 [Hordeum vulgare]|nr:hypothetical protein D1007_17835 [Hordeum vulgare]
MAEAEGQLAACWGKQDDEWRKGPWTTQEDKLLLDHVAQHGEGRWNSVSKLTGLKRSGKSCRLRWVNYLRPDLKRGKMTPQEESTIVQLHSLWGNRWSTIARSLPGRTDNEIKNYWRTHYKKGKPSKNIERARARFLMQRREMQQQQQQQQELLLGQAKDVDLAGGATVGDDVDEKMVGAIGPAATTLADHGHEELIMQDVLDFLCPMSCALLHSAGHGQSGSCGASTSDEYGSTEDDGATWGSLWNLEDVAHDGDGGACALW